MIKYFVRLLPYRKVVRRLPERCIIVSSSGVEEETFAQGGFSTVTLDWQKVIDIDRKRRVTVMFHTHPFGVGAFISSLDRKVEESFRLALGHTFFFVITDYVEVKCWLNGKVVLRDWYYKYFVDDGRCYFDFDRLLWRLMP